LSEQDPSELELHRDTLNKNPLKIPDFNLKIPRCFSAENSLQFPKR
jgi:hypothetical protein